MKKRLWNFPSATSGQIKLMEEPCAWRGMWDTARVSCDLGWRGDRSHPLSWLLDSHHTAASSQRSFAKTRLDFCSIPRLPPPPAPDTLSIPSPWLLPEVTKEQKPNKNKQKKTRGDLQSLHAVVTRNPEAKMCQKVGQGVAGARQGAGKHGELACRHWEGAKYPQTSFLSEINLLTETVLSKTCD